MHVIWKIRFLQVKYDCSRGKCNCIASKFIMSWSNMISYRFWSNWQCTTRWSREKLCVELESSKSPALMGGGRLPCLCFSVIDRSLFIVASILNPVHLIPVVTNLYRNINMRWSTLLSEPFYTYVYTCMHICKIILQVNMVQDKIGSIFLNQRWIFLQKSIFLHEPQKWPCTRLQGHLVPG